MHVLGKVFLGLTIVLAIADGYLATLLMSHRAHWQKNIEDRQASFEQTRDSLVSTRATVLDLQTKLNRMQNTWGQFLVTEGRVLNAENGTLALAAGAAAGLQAPAENGPPTAVFIFADQADGTSRYLGEFRLRDVQANQAAAQLTHIPPTVGDIEMLRQFQPTRLRVREAMPPSWRGNFGDFFANYAVAEAKLDRQANLLRIQGEQIVRSQSILDQRIAELNGDPQAPAGASLDVTDGLVLTMRREETARNGDQQVVDALRHELLRKRMRLDGLIAQNKQMVSSLPGYSESLEKPPERTAAMIR